MSGSDDSEVESSGDALPADVPQRIDGRYHVRGVLGRGGMGKVLRAHDPVLERDVAIKMINPDLRDDDEARELFLREARSVSTLSHESLVTVHDVLVSDGLPMLMTEFVEGEELRARLERIGPFPATHAVAIGARLFDALAYMHDRELIHRDVKPDNLILEPSGSLKLIDFGLTRTLEHLENQGTRMRGTPAYMAPEQLRDETLGPATDIYQAGATLYELLAGEPPFPDDSHGFAHLDEEPPPLSDRRPELPTPLTELVHQCLVKDPDERIRDARALEMRLLEIAEGLGGRSSLDSPTDAEVPIPSIDSLNRVSSGALSETRPSSPEDLVDTPASAAEHDSDDASSADRADDAASGASPRESSGEAVEQRGEGVETEGSATSTWRIFGFLLIGVVAGGVLVGWGLRTISTPPERAVTTRSDAGVEASATPPQAPGDLTAEPDAREIDRVRRSGRKILARADRHVAEARRQGRRDARREHEATDSDSTSAGERPDPEPPSRERTGSPPEPSASPSTSGASPPSNPSGGRGGAGGRGESGRAGDTVPDDRAPSDEAAPSKPGASSDSKAPAEPSPSPESSEPSPSPDAGASSSGDRPSTEAEAKEEARPDPPSKGGDTPSGGGERPSSPAPDTSSGASPPSRDREAPSEPSPNDAPETSNESSSDDDKKEDTKDDGEKDDTSDDDRPGTRFF